MKFIHTLKAAAVLLAASASAQAGLVGQPVTLFHNGDGVAGSYNATMTPVTVGSGVEHSHNDLAAALALTSTEFGDGGVYFDLADNTLTVEFSNGTNGTIRAITFGVRLMDPDLHFSNLSTVFDNFMGVSTGGWSAWQVDAQTLGFSISGLALGAPQNQYSQAAQFRFDVSELTVQPPPVAAAVPEPGSFALAGLALLGLAGTRRTVRKG